MTTKSPPLRAPYRLQRVAPTEPYMDGLIKVLHFNSRLQALALRNIYFDPMYSPDGQIAGSNACFLINGRPASIFTSDPPSSSEDEPCSFDVLINKQQCLIDGEAPLLVATRAMEILGLNDLL